MTQPMPTFFTLEKIQKQLIDIRAARRRATQPIPALKFHPADDVPGAEQPGFDDRAWPDLHVGDAWGGYDTTAWFRARVPVPPAGFSWPWRGPAAVGVNESLPGGRHARGRGDLRRRVPLLGHAHIDMAGLWRVRHPRQKGARTFATALRLMRDFPEYRFMH